MLRQDVIDKIDNFLLNINNRSKAFLVKNESRSMDSGTAYSAYHFRQALLRLPNDLDGKTKREIQDLMQKKTKRENMQPYYHLIKGLKESGLPIEVDYGKDKPFKVNYNDNSIFIEDNDLHLKHSSEPIADDDGDCLPDKHDFELAKIMCPSNDINVIFCGYKIQLD